MNKISLKLRIYNQNIQYGYRNESDVYRADGAKEEGCYDIR